MFSRISKYPCAFVEISPRPERIQSFPQHRPVAFAFFAGDDNIV
jgi:hypothetical protein